MTTPSGMGFKVSPYTPYKPEVVNMHDDVFVEKIEVFESNKPHITITNGPKECEAVVDHFKTTVIATLKQATCTYGRIFTIKSKQELNEDKIKELLEAFIKLHLNAVEHIDVKDNYTNKPCDIRILKDTDEIYKSEFCAE